MRKTSANCQTGVIASDRRERSNLFKGIASSVASLLPRNDTKWRFCLAMTAILLFLMMAVNAAAGHAATYYVADPKGADGIAGTADDVNSSDSNPGTLVQPFAAIQKAANIVNPGDAVLVMGGTYYEQVNVLRNGAQEARIIFKNHNDELVIINAQGVRDYGFKVGNTQIETGHYITIDGFTVINTRGNAGNSGGIIFINCNGAIVKNCHTYNNALYGIAGYGKVVDSIIENCHSHNNYINIRLRQGDDLDYTARPLNCTVRWNHIHHTDRGEPGNSDGSDLVGTDNCVYEHNLMHHNIEDGLDDDGSTNTIVRYNIAYLQNPNGLPTSGSNGIKLTVNDQGNKTVYYNISFLNPAMGFQLGRESHVYHNLAYGNGAAGFGISNNGGTVVKNNLAFGNNLSDMDYDPNNILLMDYNFIGDGKYAAEKHIHCLSGDPRVSNLGMLSIDNNSDGTPDILDPLNDPDAFPDARSAVLYAKQQMALVFGLESNSPLIDAGIDVGENYSDILENPAYDGPGKTPWPGESGANVYDMGPIELQGKTIYVDNLNTGDCAGNYNIETRRGDGSDGDKYDTLQEAADAMEAGDTVLVRGGTYAASPNSGNEGILFIDGRTESIGVPGREITFSNYQNEKVIIDASNFLFGIQILFERYMNFRGFKIINSKQEGMKLLASHHMTVENCIFMDNANTALDITFSAQNGEVSHDITVQNNHFENNKHRGLNFAGAGYNFNVIDNTATWNGINVVEDGQGMTWAGPTDSIFSKNIVFNQISSGISGQDASNIIVEDAISWKTTRMVDPVNPNFGADGRGILHRSSGSNSIIRGSVAFDHPLLGIGIDGITDGQVYNNLVFDSGECPGPPYPEGWDCPTNGAGFMLSGPRYLAVNNVGIDNRGEDFDFGSGANRVIHHNASSDTSCAGFESSINNLDPQALFIDYDAAKQLASFFEQDYQNHINDIVYKQAFRDQMKQYLMPRAGSPLIDAGAVIPGYHCVRPDDDPVNPMDPNAPGRHWYGLAPDIGAYEYAPDQGEPVTGDITGKEGVPDRIVNVLDVQACVNIILQVDTDPVHIARAKQLNEHPENDVTVTNLQAIVNKILGV